MYNQVRQSSGACMPLIMGYTQPEKIREAESDEPVVYDQRLQFAVVYPFVMRVVLTKCRIASTTRKSNGKGVRDEENRVDDNKTVK